MTEVAKNQISGRTPPVRCVRRKEGCSMTEYIKSYGGVVRRIDSFEPGCWINLVAPSAQETDALVERFDFDPDYIRSSLDEEESSRIESEDGNTLIITDLPYVERLDDSIVYDTMSVGIIVTKTCVITIAFKENPILTEIAEGVLKGINTEFKTQFVLRLMLRAASRFLQYLKQIDKLTEHTERELRKNMRNKELVTLLDLKKSLVYFSTSLKGNEITLEKMRRGRLIKLYEEDQDLLEDLLIEVRQAIEMTTIYTNVLAGTMETSESLISNNLNTVMKVLASITIVINVPTIISGLYGMNINGGYLPFAQFWWFPCVLSLVVMLVLWYILRKKQML